MKQVVVQTLGSRAIHGHVGHGQHFQQEAHSLVLVRGRAEQTLCVQHDEAQARLIRCPHPDGAGSRRGRRSERFLALKQHVVERVRFAIAGVAEDREHLDSFCRAAAQFPDEVTSIFHLGMSQTQGEGCR